MGEHKGRKVAVVPMPPRPTLQLWNHATAIRTRETIRAAIEDAGFDYGLYTGQKVSLLQSYLDTALRQDPTLKMNRRVWKVVQEL